MGSWPSFFAMFFLMLWNTFLVFSDGVAQFAFGFCSVMLTSTVLGLFTMVLFKPRSWCVYCPMGTMTQLSAGPGTGEILYVPIKHSDFHTTVPVT